MTKNKATALVTGGSIRIGQAIALKLSNLGFNIALHYNSSETQAIKTRDFIRKNKVRCEIFQCDLSDENETLKLTSQVLKWAPNLNILINSASIFEKSSLSNWNFSHYERHWNINFKAPFILTSAFALRVKKGQVINILDTNVVKNKTAHLIYLLSKKALFEFTKLSATELAPRIRVNAVAPGAILPPPGVGQSYLKNRVKSVPLRNSGNPEQIADAVAFLVNSPYITGQVIFNDGGEHLLSA